MKGNSFNGTAQFEARINNPDVASALTRLLDRMDALESAMQQLNSTVGQAPAMAAMVGDIADEAYHTAATQGIDLEERGKAALHLLAQLTEPRMMAQLQGLLMLAEQAPGLAAMAGDMMDNAYRSAAAQGIDLEERATTGLHLLKRLTDPNMALPLTQLLDLAEQAPALMAMAGDVIDDAYRSAHDAGVDLETMVKQGGVAAQRLSTLMRSPEFTALMDSGMLDPKAVSLLGSAANALVKSQEAHPQKIGPMGLVGALRDPDVQKTLGFFMAFAKEFGRGIA